MSESIDLPKSNINPALYVAGIGLALIFGTAAIGFGIDHANGCHNYSDQQRIEDAKVPAKCRVIPKPASLFNEFPL